MRQTLVEAYLLFYRVRGLGYLWHSPTLHSLLFGGTELRWSEGEVAIIIIIIISTLINDERIWYDFGRVVKD